MSPEYAPLVELADGLPRTRGDEPIVMPYGVTVRSSAPHPRG